MISKIEYILSKVIKKLHLRAILNSHIHKTSKVCAGSQIINVKIDKHSDIGYDCTILNTEGRKEFQLLLITILNRFIFFIITAFSACSKWL